MSDWLDYQEEVAGVFRSVGLSAVTNENIEGIRTSHTMDVVVRSKHVGIKMIWLVECKYWNRPISKDRVLTLRTIVDDTGSDRGFMMAENGYQSGAVEAANRTNITLSSIAELQETLSEELGAVKLRSILERVEVCRDRYWAIDKPDRIALGLRHDVGTIGYSGATVITAVELTAGHALGSGFPIRYDRQLAAISSFAGSRRDLKVTNDEEAITNSADLYVVLDGEISDLEARLNVAERILRERADH